ncbi:hypothetical protein ACQUFR_06135 [Acinetobacter johnsonii]|jgi:hypothetical protein|uniref:hypothetical protein n=1 Tax=Acinetobacter johnsonii TaxID=40214 RepID=UPI003D181E78
MSISFPRRDITKFLISTPSSFSGICTSENYYLIEANDNHRKTSYSARTDERIFRQYLELAVETPEYDGKSLIIPDYTHISDNFCIAMSVLFGKRFDSHGLLQQHGRGYVPVMDGGNEIYNKNLCFNSLEPRSNYRVSLDLANFKKIQKVIFEQEENLKPAQEAFLYAGRFYAQSLRQVETSPEIAFLSLITVGEILSSYFKYPIKELIDQDTVRLLTELRQIENIGEKLAKKVEKKLGGISEAFCKYFLECLDDDFFNNPEAKNAYEQLKKEDIKQRLKAAYNIRSVFVHTGKFHSNWMSVNHFHNNEEVINGNPVIGSKETEKMIKRSPTFLGMERIMRYGLLMFLVRTKIVDNFNVE